MKVAIIGVAQFGVKQRTTETLLLGITREINRTTYSQSHE